jgi:hypothetical protein
VIAPGSPLAAKKKVAEPRCAAPSFTSANRCCSTICLLDHLLFQPDSSLVKQSYMPRMLQMLNLAGFGMMVWDHTSHDAEMPFRYGSTALPVFDRNLKNLSQKIRANCFLGHVPTRTSIRSGIRARNL